MPQLQYNLSSMYTKEEIIETALADIEIAGLNVLVAGGGRRSTRHVINCSPEKLMCVCVPGDDDKVTRIFNELGGDRKDAEVIASDLSEAGLFEDASFDLIIADYLISKIDLYAPRKQIDTLQSLHDYLKPERKLVLIDIEPDQPPSHDVESETGIISALIKGDDQSRIKLDNISRHKIYCRARKLVVDLALNQGIPGFREIPGDWVERWLIGIGFKNVTPQIADRSITVDINSKYEKRIRSFIRLIDDDKIQKYVEALLDRTEAMLREVCPFDYKQDVYIISAEK